MFEEDYGGEGGSVSLDIRRTYDGVTQRDERLESAGPRRHCKDLGFQSECSGRLGGTLAEDVCQLTYILGGSLWPLS